MKYESDTDYGTHPTTCQNTLMLTTPSHAHNILTCSQHPHKLTTPSQAHNILTSSQHPHKLTTPACSQHPHMLTTPSQAHNTLTCSQHPHMLTTPSHAHNTLTCSQHPHMLTTHLLQLGNLTAKYGDKGFHPCPINNNLQELIISDESTDVHSCLLGYLYKRKGGGAEVNEGAWDKPVKML